MDAHRRAHIAVKFPEANDSAVAGAAQKQKVRAIRICVISGKYTVVAFFFSDCLKQCISIGIMVFQFFFVFMEHLPDFHQRKKTVACNRLLGCKYSQDPTAAQKRLVICSKPARKMPDDCFRLFLLVSNPFEELGTERPVRKKILFGGKERPLRGCGISRHCCDLPPRSGLIRTLNILNRNIWLRP